MELKSPLDMGKKINPVNGKCKKRILNDDE